MRTIIKFVLMWSLTCLCGLSIWKVCKARMIVSTQPQKSLELFPAYSEALFALNEESLREGLDSAVAKNIKNRAELGLRKQPIHDIPFVHIALAQSLVEKKFARRDLYAFAKKRNISNRRTLRSLLALDAAQNDLAGVMLSLDTLIKVSGQTTPSYHNIFTQIAMREEGRTLINTYLKTRPIWGEKFLEKQINSMNAIDIAHISMFLSHYANQEAGRERNRNLQEKFLQKLVKLGAYEQAYSHWKTTLPESNALDLSLIVDGNFRGNKSYSPFNWKVFRRENSFAEINVGEGLYASFANGPDRALAQQVLRLRPEKSYQLKIDARWTYRQRQGLFTWLVKCLPTQKVLTDIVMNDAIRPNRTATNIHSSVFTVPTENCDAQQIQLRAKTGQYSKRIWATTKSVEVVEMGLQQ